MTNLVAGLWLIELLSLVSDISLRVDVMLCKSGLNRRSTMRFYGLDSDVNFNSGSWMRYGISYTMPDTNWGYIVKTLSNPRR